MGSPRSMMQAYQDAMAIVSLFGKPDLFITMTCNPLWSEISDNLFPGQKWGDINPLRRFIFPSVCWLTTFLNLHEVLHIIHRSTRNFIGKVLNYLRTLTNQTTGQKRRTRKSTYCSLKRLYI